MNAETAATIENFLSLAESQENYHRSRWSQPSNDPEEEATHSKLASEFSRLAEFLRDLGNERTGPPQATGLLAVTPKDLEGLPEEVKDELSMSDADKLHHTILGLAEASRCCRYSPPSSRCSLRLRRFFKLR